MADIDAYYDEAGTVAGGGAGVVDNKKPSLKHIQDTITRLDGKWRHVHANMMQWEEWATNGVEPSRVPKGYDAFKEPLGWIARGAAAQLVTDTPVFEARATKKGTAGDEQKQKWEGYATDQWEWADKQARCSVAAELGRQVFQYGMCVLQGPIFDVNAWPDEPKQEGLTDEEYEAAKDAFEAQQEMKGAFRYAPVNPIWACPFDNNVGIVIKYEREVADIVEAFPNWKWPEKYSLESFVTWEEYYDGRWRCFLAAGKPVLENNEGDGIVPCNRVPYQWAFSTFGKNAKGATPEEKVISIYAGLEPALKQRNNMFTALFADINNRVFKKFLERVGGKNWNSDRVRFPANMGAGARIKVRDKDDLTILDEKTMPPDFNAIIGYLTGMVERNTYSPTMIGQGATARTATGQGMTIQQQRLLFSPMVKEIERVISEAVTKAFYEFKFLSDSFLTSMPAGEGGLKLNADDVVRPVNIKVALTPTDPERDDRLIDAGMKLRGDLSDFTRHKDFYKKDPEEELRRKMFEAVVMSDNVRQMIETQSMALAAADIQLNKMKEIAERAAKGQMPYMGQGAAGELAGGDMVPSPEGGALPQGGAGSMPAVRPDQFAGAGKMSARGVTPNATGPYGSSAEGPPDALNQGGGG